MGLREGMLEKGNGARGQGRGEGREDKVLSQLPTLPLPGVPAPTPAFLFLMDSLWLSVVMGSLAAHLGQS